jgi:hypothetical protein
MKAWRLQAEQHNKLRALGLVKGAARQKMRTERLIQKILDRGVRSNWLLAGLMNRGGFTPKRTDGAQI